MQSAVVEVPTVDAEGAGTADTRPSLTAIFGITVLGAIPIALLPGFFYPTNLRQALAFSVLPLGVWLIARAAAKGDAAARLAAVFVTVALVSALTGEHVVVSVFGTLTLEMSVVAVASAFGWWAVGRRLSPSVSRTLVIVLTGGVGVNVLVGVLQMIADPRSGIYGSFEGRLSGLMSNPVYFASTSVGIWAYWFMRSRRSPRVWELALVLALAFCLGLSGSRVAALVIGAIVLAAAVWDRGRRATLVSGVGSVVGVGVGTIVLNLASAEQSVRYSSTDGGTAVRLAVWRNALATWVERPFLGSGIDPYLRDANQRFGRAQVSEFGSMQWPDPHNVVLLVLLSFGLVGMIVLIAFVAFAFRGTIDFALLAAAAAMATTWLLQPVVVTTWPIAFALFGAAVRPRELGREHPVDSRAERLLVAGGAVITVAMIAWNLQFTSVLATEEAGSVVDARASIMILDPTVAARVADKYVTQSLDGAATDAELQRAETLARRAVDQSDSAAHWALLAEIQLARSDPQGAFETSRRWVEQWPNDPRGFRYLGATADMTGNSREREIAALALCEIRNECDRVESGAGPDQ